MRKNIIYAKRTLLKTLTGFMVGIIFILLIGSTLTTCAVNDKIKKEVKIFTATSDDGMKRLEQFKTECYHLMDASTITYLITLIVCFFATLIFTRTEKMGDLIHKNELLEENTYKLNENITELTKKTKDLIDKNELLEKKLRESISELSGGITKSKALTIFFTNVESIFSITVMIDNLSGINNAYSQNQIGILCSRIFIMCETLRDSLHSGELNGIHKKERQILFAYLDDIIGLFNRASNNLATTIIKKIVDHRCKDMEEIKRKVEIIDVRE